MSQFPGAYQDPYNQATFDPPKTSGLAITALVFSLILCCPITTVVGPLLGAVAFLTIGKNPNRKGKGLALAAIIIGVVATAIWIFVGFSAWNGFKEFSNTPAELVRAGQTGDLTTFKSGFGPAGAAATDAEAQAFLDALKTRYGSVVRSDMDFEAFGQLQQGGSQVMGFPFRVVFEKQTVTFEMQFDPNAQKSGGGKAIFESVTVREAGSADLVFPQGAAASATSPRARGRGPASGQPAAPPPPATIPVDETGGEPETDTNDGG